MYFTQDSDDGLLVQRSLAGEEAAFEALITRYERALFGVALRMLGDYDDARDATQAAFVKAYRKLATFDPKFRFFSWMYRILLNECLNTRRGRRLRQPLAPDLLLDRGPLEALEVAERRKRVQQALLALTFEQREVILLRHFGDLGYDEIAATVGIPVKTVKSRLYTARQRLIELLDEKARHARTP